MTLEDFNYWGSPFPVTLIDDNGFPIGYGLPDGTIVKCGTSNVGKTYNNTIVVWDGAKPDPTGGYSKGRLLAIDGPPYIDSLVIFRYMWGDNGKADETETGDGVTEQKAPVGNRKKGKQGAKRRKQAA